MEDYSLTAIAKILGRAKSGLHKLAKAGQIQALPNGRYDLASVQKALAANIDPSRRRAAHPAAGERPGEQKPARVNAPTSSRISTPEEAAEAVSLVRRVLEEEGVKCAVVDFSAARTAELILKSHARKQRLDVESGKLVDHDTAKRKTFEMSRRDRDAWANWPSRVSPMMAADLDVDPVKLVIVLEKYVRQQQLDNSQPEGK